MLDFVNKSRTDWSYEVRHFEERTTSRAKYLNNLNNSHLKIRYES